MTDVTFSVKRHLIENPSYRWITTCIEKMMNRVGVISMVPWTRYGYTGLHWLLLPQGVLAALKFRDEAMYFAKTRLQQENLPEGRKDVFSNLQNAKDPETGNGLPLPEVLAEAGVLIVAVSRQVRS